ncbi:PucR family transcriptional regulator [Jatrophihabitans fulvus]
MARTPHWVTQLQPSQPPATQAAPPLDPGLDVVVEALGAGPVEWALELGRGMSAAIEERIPQLAVDGIVQDVRRGCESVALGVLGMLALDAGFDPGAALGVVTGPSELVARGVGSDVMLLSLQLAHGVAHAAVVDAVLRLVPPDERFDESRRIAEVLFAVVEAVSSAMISEFDRAHSRWQASSSAARMDVIELLLRGETVADERVGEVLNYDLSRHHTALVLWTDDAVALGVGALERVASDVLTRAGCSDLVVQPIGRGRVWAWGGTVQAGVVMDGQAAIPPGVRVAVGRGGAGASGFRVSHQRALEATRLGQRSVRPDGRLFAYDDVDLLVMLTERPDLLRAFVHRELGGLADPAATVATVRDTLRVYLDTGRSLQDTAHQLHVARNTVAYRVRRAEELRGRPLADHHMQLRVALAVVHELGMAPLEDAQRPH